ncbi:hypothetical protein D9619_006208 [Psilocybe cf. subviscida]|uniref:amidase n=1 Tax=Psilocybe cf. subviscida TaxID=2480587 RepID=A0A8H5EXL3_9AGAR|nr:hypothetical protein D9619_006208 [Psilocybe cf. subviscida]
MWPFTPSNAPVVAAKRAERAQGLADIPALDEAQSSIVKATIAEIVAHIESGEWTATQVLEAYLARAAFAQAKTNCLTEIMAGSARERAAHLDAEFAATKKLVGPLHGIPVSIKDQIEIEGYDAAVGFSQWANKPATKNADVIKQLLDAGAVLYVKTNIPQTMFAFECSNPIWGRTTNPWNENYTCGGSSGGEGALIAMDGSPVGIGTDIGGSLRIPAAYCGIFSLKPAAGRVSYHGARGPVPGFDGIVSVAGPMARSVKDLEIVARTLFGGPSTTDYIPPLPFREVSIPKKLKFGYYTSDNFIKASPACKRAVVETVEALRKAGHECVEFEIPDSYIPFNLFAGITSSDGYKTMLSHLGPDKKENALWLVTTGPRLPGFIRSFLAWSMETFFNDTLFSKAMRITKEKTVGEYWNLLSQKQAYVERFYQEIWEGQGFDGIIAPVQAVPQLPHGGCDNFSALAEATILYNVLDLPVGCLPVTRVDPAKDQLTEEWVTGPGLGSPLLEAGIYRGKKPIYNPEASKGMPVNIQIAGKKWEEEKLLKIMEVVDEALGKGRGFGPGSWDLHNRV